MSKELRSRLEVVISVALAVVPRRVRRGYVDKLALTSDPARQEIAAEIAAAVATAFEVKEKPPQIGHG